MLTGMANYYSSSRTNFFAVKSGAAFTEAMAKLGVEVCDGEEADTYYLLGDGEGGWPHWLEDEETGEDIEFDFIELVAEHLADGHVAVFMEAGAEKLRYIVGSAVAINNKNERAEISLEDIYDGARGLGAHCTRCEY